MLPKVSGISDMRDTIHQAWSVTREIVAPIAPFGIDRMDRNQFRCLCVYLWYFIKLWDIFVQISDLGTEKRKVHQKQFEELLLRMQDWGIQDVAMWQKNPDACFQSMDRSRQGWVMFEDLAESILRRAVPLLCAEGEEDSRAEAVRLLRRNHPELMGKEPPKDRSWNGVSPPVPPPGQKCPPMPAEFEGIRQGGISNRHFTTQYMSDYLSPNYLPSEIAAASSSSTRSQVLTRTMTPHAARPPSDLATGIALIRSSSLPDATMRTQGLDKQALRMKLENHLDMYSTGQMRKLLKVAGGMVVGPGGGAR